MKPTSNTALITGATSGIGHAFARQLAAEGYNLHLVARTESRLETAAEALVHEYGISVTTHAADLSTDAGIDTIAEVIATYPFNLVINNAGYGLSTSVLDASTEELRALEAIHVTAVQVLSHTAAHTMVERGYGGIITISSIASILSWGAYSAMKSASWVFMENLSAELRHTPVTATAVLPGLIATAFHDRTGQSMERVPRFAWVPVDAVVRTALADARRGKAVSIPGWQYKVAFHLGRRLPRWLTRRIR